MHQKHKQFAKQNKHSRSRFNKGGGIFRTSPLARFVVLFAAAAVLFIALLFPSWHFDSQPQILSISPQVGVPGDVVTITGSNFGASRDGGGDATGGVEAVIAGLLSKIGIKKTAYKGASKASDVEFGGYALTRSAYIKWTDDEIVIKLPMNVKDGLVFVRTEKGLSNPAFFSNATEVPMPVTAALDAPKPVISDMSATSLFIGSLLTISGSGFGGGIVGAGSSIQMAGGDTALGMAGFAPQVFFESAGERMPASALLYDIESWNDTEIKVRVIDGATSGSVAVETINGTSESKQLTVRSNGVKYYGDKRTYVVRLAADIKDLALDSPTHIRLYFPRPVRCATQVSAEMTECIPDVPDEDYQGKSLRILKADAGDRAIMGKTNYQEEYAVAVRSVRVVVNNPSSVSSRTGMSPYLYDAATRADAIIPANDNRVSSLSKEMAGNAKGAYNIARAIYSKMLDRFHLTDTKTDTCYPLAMLESGSGDAYDFAVVYTALLRAAGVPSLPCSGIIVDSERKAKPHWWSVFYVAGLGWVPVDAAIGSKAGGREAGFARLDAQHITFSCGYQAMKSVLSRANIVQRPKSYSLQSIWEESTKETRRYSSLWADPTVVGVY